MCFSALAIMAALFALTGAVSADPTASDATTIKPTASDPPAIEATSAAQSVGGPADWSIPGGRFYSQASGVGRASQPAGTALGYRVIDDAEAHFWAEFRRLGGVDALGYPSSRRFVWDGFVAQIFQRGVLQWRPEAGAAVLVNVFDRLHDLGYDDYLAEQRQTPRPASFAEADLAWPEVASRRLATLDAWPALRASYFATTGDAVAVRGLPVSPVTDEGSHYAIRLQRTVLQQWKQDVPWARAGEVTVALGGDILKEIALREIALNGPSAGEGAPGTSSTLVPAAALTPEALFTDAARPPRRVFLGYYVPYDSASWISVRQNAADLDYVATQTVTVDPCGRLSTDDDATLGVFARQSGLGLLPSLLTSSEWLNHRLLTDPETTARFIDDVVEYVDSVGYSGFDLDLEAVAAGDRVAYSALVGRLAEALHTRGKLLSVAIPARTAESHTGWASAYDYAAIGRSADMVLVMAYAYTWSTSAPGSTAPRDWVERVATYAASEIPTDHLLLGVPFFGFDWNVTTGAPAPEVSYSRLAAIAGARGLAIVRDSPSGSATFAYTAASGDPPANAGMRSPSDHEITQRRAPTCSVREPGEPPSQPQPVPTRAPAGHHVVWLEDGTSVAEKLAVARRIGALGVGAWRLGDENPAVWSVIREWRASE